jgi:hippurate hydrolase
MEQIAEEFEGRTGAKFSLAHTTGYPAVVNPPTLFDETKKTLESAGFAFFEPQLPLMQSEDFSYYQRAVPGMFLFVGTGIDTPLHSADYNINEDTLLTGVRLFQALIGIKE